MQRFARDWARWKGSPRQPPEWGSARFRCAQAVPDREVSVVFAFKVVYPVPEKKAAPASGYLVTLVTPCLRCTVVSSGCSEVFIVLPHQKARPGPTTVHHNSSRGLNWLCKGRHAARIDATLAGGLRRKRWDVLSTLSTGTRNEGGGGIVTQSARTF